MKKQKGITLIALVITIIVLLILAGVSISMVIGNNGILNQASIADRDTTRGSEKEQVEMAFLAAKTLKLTDSDYNSSEVYKADLETALKNMGLVVEGNDPDVTVTGEPSNFTVTFKSGNVYTIENEIVTPTYNDNVVTPDEPEINFPEGMYSVNEKLNIADEELFETEVLDETAKTIKITGINNGYMTHEYVDGINCIYRVSYNSISIDTLVVPYEIDGYTVTEVDLMCGVTDTFGQSVKSALPDVKRIIYPNTVTKIGSNVHDGTYANGKADNYRKPRLEEVVLPKNLSVIGNDVFAYCSGITNITIPETVTSIGNGAFFNCDGLTKITIPKNVNSIGREAFSYCSNLAEVRFEMVTAPTWGSDCFGASDCDDLTYYFKNKTVSDSMSMYYGTKSEDYNW